MYRPCLHCEGKRYDENYCPEICAYGEARKRLKELEEQEKHGKWIVKRTASKLHIGCSCCNHTKRFDRLESISNERLYIINDFIKEHRFCPNCGAMMDLK